MTRDLDHGGPFRYGGPLRDRHLARTLRAIETRQFAVARDEAARLFSAAPDDPVAALFLGLALGGLGRPKAAAAFLHRARRPGFRHPVHDLVPMLTPGDAVVAQYDACLRLSPDEPDLRRACAEVLIETGDPTAALALLRSLDQNPADQNPADQNPADQNRADQDPAALLLAGIARHDLGCYEAALELFQRASVLVPGDAAPWSNIGMVLKVLGRFDASLDAYDQALARKPGDARIRVNRAVALLRAGHMTEAWRDYECRFALPGQVPVWPLARLLPDLSQIGQSRTGQSRTDVSRTDVSRTGVSGKTILATHEEGFGDTLHFARYLPLLARRGARVLLLVPRSLTRLMRRMEGVAAVIEPDDPVPAFDWHCPMFSLPRAFGTTMATIPAQIPYLNADPALTEAWAARLPPRSQRLRVGLVWAGQARPWGDGFTALDARRSLDPALLAPLAGVPDVEFVSLQKYARDRPPFPTLDPMAEVGDFDDTAAIVAGLDLVVSVDTSVVHLAGGLGRPVFLLDRYDNCWRWLSDRTDSPWYPSLRVFRQSSPGDWAGVVERVAAALRSFASPDRGR